MPEDNPSEPSVETPPEALVDAAGQRHARAGADARVVSLVPSITELLFALGLGARVVGRTGFCVHPREDVRRVPKLGGTKDVDLAALADLSPTHVIVNVDENTRETFDALRAFVPHVVVTHPERPEDNLGLYALLGGIFGRTAEARVLAERFSAALERTRCAGARLPARRVLYLIWRDPWMTVSAGTYIASMLALVGWRCVECADPARYPVLEAAEVGALAPDLVLLSSEPYPFREKHRAEVAGLVAPGTPVRLVDGEMLSWYGSRAVAGLDYLAALAAEAQAA